MHVNGLNPQMQQEYLNSMINPQVQGKGTYFSSTQQNVIRKNQGYTLNEQMAGQDGRRSQQDKTKQKTSTQRNNVGHPNLNMYSQKQGLPTEGRRTQSSMGTGSVLGPGQQQSNTLNINMNIMNIGLTGIPPQGLINGNGGQPTAPMTAGAPQSQGMHSAGVAPSSGL